MEMLKRYANGMTANTLTISDAELLLKNLHIENWLAERIKKYFGAYCSSSNDLDFFVRDSEKAVAAAREGKMDEAQRIIDGYTHYVTTFNLSIDNRDAFDWNAYAQAKAEAEAKKNMITDRQRSYLEYLLNKANRTADLGNMTKAEASALISELKGE